MSDEIEPRYVACHHCAAKAETTQPNSYGQVMRETGYMPVILYSMKTLWFCPACTEAIEPAFTAFWNLIRPAGSPDAVDAEGGMKAISKYGNFNFSVLAASILRMREERKKAERE